MFMLLSPRLAGNKSGLNNDPRKEALRLSQRSERLGLSEGVPDTAKEHQAHGVGRDTISNGERPLKNDDRLSNKPDHVVPLKHDRSQSKNGPVEKKSQMPPEEHLNPADNEQKIPPEKSQKIEIPDVEEREMPKMPSEDEKAGDKSKVRGEKSEPSTTEEAEKTEKNKSNIKGEKTKTTEGDQKPADILDRGTIKSKRPELPPGMEGEGESESEKIDAPDHHEPPESMEQEGGAEPVPLKNKTTESTAIDAATEATATKANITGTTNDSKLPNKTSTTVSMASNATSNNEKKASNAMETDAMHQVEIFSNFSSKALNGTASLLEGNSSKIWEEEAIDENFQPIKGANKAEIEEAAREAKEERKEVTGSESQKDANEGKAEMEVEGMEPLHNTKEDVDSDEDGGTNEKDKNKEGHVNHETIDLDANGKLNEEKSPVAEKRDVL